MGMEKISLSVLISFGTKCFNRVTWDTLPLLLSFRGPVFQGIQHIVFQQFLIRDPDFHRLSCRAMLPIPEKTRSRSLTPLSFHSKLCACSPKHPVPLKLPGAPQALHVLVYVCISDAEIKPRISHMQTKCPTSESCSGPRKRLTNFLQEEYPGPGVCGQSEG